MLRGIRRMAARGRIGVVPVLWACAPAGTPDPGGGPLPDRATGLSLPWTEASCGRADPVADTDADGLDDRCELGLARAFAPLLVVRPGGCGWDTSVSPARPGGEYYFAVERGGEAGRIRIAYLPAYYRDCGWDGLKFLLPFVDCAPHVGDSEAIVVEIGHDGRSGRWRTEAVFLSAHCFGRSGGDCRWYRGDALARFEWADGRDRGAPRVWVAEGRNANYPSRDACDRGHYRLDTCDRHGTELRFPVVTMRQNLGSRARPAGGPGGCVHGGFAGWASALPRAGRIECFWRDDAPFFGWQSPDGGGATPYARYLLEVAGF
ncbi:MAG TPA: hypothetical protein VF212_16565 [Longimicrobiales bacterium]